MIAQLCLLALAAGGGPPGDAPPQRAEGTEWVVEVHPSQPVKVAKPSRVDLLVGTRAGFHLNDDYPITFVPSPAEGVSYAKPRFEAPEGLVQRSCPRDPRHHCAAKLSATFTMAAPGKARVGGVLSFGTCNDDTCLIETVEVSTLVRTSGAPPRPPR